MIVDERTPLSHEEAVRVAHRIFALKETYEMRTLTGTGLHLLDSVWEAIAEDCGDRVTKEFVVGRVRDAFCGCVRELWGLLRDELGYADVQGLFHEAVDAVLVQGKEDAEDG